MATPQNLTELPPELHRMYQSLFHFYDDDADRNRLLYVGLKMLVISSAAAIPVVSLATRSRLSTAVLGAVIAIAEGYMGLTKLHERWVAYRKAAEDLRMERLMWDAGSGPYANRSNRTQLFGDRMIAVIQHERGDWETLFAQPPSPIADP